MTELENLNPNVYAKSVERIISADDKNDSIIDAFDVREIFDLIRNINDPEHPLSLEELHVLQLNQVSLDKNDSIIDAFDVREIFDLIRNINDPEHPLSLEELHVLQLNQVSLDKNDVTIHFTPTIPHCSMATLIGLSIRVKLLHTLPSRFKVTVEITPGTHSSEHAINKQLKDKERVAAALENVHLKSVINQCIAGKN